MSLRPTCKECAHVFPVACFNELKEYYDDDVREEISRRAMEETLELELNARKYCYLTYFGPILGIDMPSDEDSDDTPSTKQSEDTSSTRRLLSSSSESSSGDSFDSVLKPDDVDKFRLMEKDGDLTCPPPQCMTKHDALLKPLVAPWYHVTNKGSCKWNGCNGRPMGNEYCQDGVDSCISCRGTWCPPRLVPFWNPVMADNYQSRKPILPITDFTSVFPRAACSNDPLTDIRKTVAKALPWTDLAGDVMTPHFLDRSLEPEDANQIEIIREKLEQDWLYGLPQKERREAIRHILDREKADNEALKQADEAAERAVKNYVNRQQQLVQQEQQQDSSPQGPAATKQAAAKKRAAQQARELEESARAYCHLSYVNEAEAFGGGQQAGRKQSNIGGRSLLQGRDYSNAAPIKSSLPQAMLRKFSKMQMLEQISCPPAECYFADLQDQDNTDEDEMEDNMPQDQAAEDDGDDGNTSTAVMEWSLRMQLPWYHRMGAGYCTWSPTCDGKTGVKGTYCSASAENCVKRCSRGIWCPPVNFLNWEPVVSSNYTTLKRAKRALSGNNPGTNNRSGMMADTNADSTVYSMQTAQSGTSSATLTMSFDFFSCQKKPVTGITLSAAEGLEWPGMIDIAAAAKKQAAGSP